jgi:hypothetical protein
MFTYREKVPLMNKLLAILLCLPLLSQACTPPRDDYGRILRSKKVLAAFRATVPCPGTGETGKRCVGFVVDHIVPLACCGADRVANLQWQTIADGKAKDKVERRLCGAPD